MPHALTIDRQMFAALVMQGFNAVQVANKLNMKPQTARTWITRMGLRDTQLKLKQELEAVKKPDMALQIATSAGERTRKLVGSAIERDLSFLEHTPATENALGVHKRYTKIEPAIRIAEKVYGWSDDQRGPSHVTLNQLNVSQPAPAQGQIIDVSGDKVPDSS